MSALLITVAPHVGAWIETLALAFAAFFAASHPMWVRGLKLNVSPYLACLALSHPMWVRGLKLIHTLYNFVVAIVAPHVGAWIETAST